MPMPARFIARAVLIGPGRLTRPEAAMAAANEAAMPDLPAARRPAGRFRRMVRSGTPEAVPAWIAEAQASRPAPFGRGTAADQPAVSAALAGPCLIHRAERRAHR
jgi:hypothetical protein